MKLGTRERDKSYRPFFHLFFVLFCFAGYTKFYVNEHERLSNITLRQK
jgi:hypothetical protein